MPRIEGLTFIKPEEIFKGAIVPLDPSLIERDLPLKCVLLNQVVSAFGIDSWNEALGSLPPIYLHELASSVVAVSVPVLMEHNGVYVGTGVGNRAIAMGKYLGRESIMARVICEGMQ